MSQAVNQPTSVEDLNTLLDEVKSDPADQAESIRRRTQEFLGASNVSMMGGWV
jgi:hypothetical protein